MLESLQERDRRRYAAKETAARDARDSSTYATKVAEDDDDTVWIIEDKLGCRQAAATELQYRILNVTDTFTLINRQIEREYLERL